MTDRFIKLKHDAFYYIGEGETQTIVQKLGFRNKAVLECIALHQDATCHSDITQRQIAKALGISPTTVNQAIKELEKFTYEGKPVIEVKQFYEGKKQRNLYKILPNLLVSQYGEKSSVTKSETLEDVSVTKIETLEEVSVSNSVTTKEEQIKELNKKNIEEDDSMRTMNPKEVVTLFVDCLKKNGESYKVVWGRDTKLAKSFLKKTEDLVNNDKKRLVEIIVENYRSWGNTAQFPLHVGTLQVDWVLERANKVLTAEKENVSQMEKQTVEANKRQKAALDSIMSRIKQKGGAK